METVLREDREALRNLQKHQPRFTDEQKKELSQVHPWVRTGRLPRAINISVSPTPEGCACDRGVQRDPPLTNVSFWFQGCAGCKCPPAMLPDAPFDVEIHEMELCTVLKAQEESFKKNRAADAHPEEEEDDEAEEKEAEAHQAAVAEAQSLRSGTLERQGET